MNSIPTITEDDLQARIDPRSFQRGRQYFQRGAILGTRKQGTTIKAYCRGSMPEPYRVEVTFGDDGITSASCSCPIGAGGYCKHVAALLLTWLDRPGDFSEVETLDAALERRDRDELITLIKHMLSRDPNLETLLETPLPGGRQPDRPIDSGIYREQAASAFLRAGDEWDAAIGVARDQLAILEIGDGFLAQEDYASAAMVYGGVADAFLEHYVMLHDEEGELGRVVYTCVERLGQCLDGVDDPGQREGILESLFEIYCFDLDHLGGVGFADEAPELLIDHTTAEERDAIAGWIRNVLPQGNDWGSNWSRQAYGGLLLDLEEGKLDDETFLNICRETGRTGDLTDHLLALGRLDEAVAESKAVGDYELLRLTGIFDEYGHNDVAERLVRERSATSDDLRLESWLKDRYAARGDYAAALDIAMQHFRMRPWLPGYREIRDLAGRLDRWDELRPDLLSFLDSENKVVLVQAYLDDGEIGEALAALERVQSSRSWYGVIGFGLSNLRLQVAKAAEEPRPRAAIEIYREDAEALIEVRGRDRYSSAAGLLGSVKTLYEKLGEREVWDDYILDLRSRHHRLPALQDELNKAGL